MKFTEEHEWLRVEDDLVVVGITEHAATQLGDVVSSCPKRATRWPRMTTSL